MKITALVENTVGNKLVEAEHGLSLFIETQGRRILFDMGQTNLFESNAEKLGVNLSAVETAVLSHGHYDHGGGLKRFLEINGNAPVYISRYAFEPHYNGEEKYIGLDTSLEENSRLVTTYDVTEISDGITIYSCRDNPSEHNLGSFGLNMLSDGKLVPDDFRHEQYLLVNEDGKRVLFSGCSHKSIMDIVSRFRPDVLIGGFHFSKLPLDEKLASYAEFLDGFDTDYYTCHCTGTEQYGFMRGHMRKLNYISCGETIVL